MKYQNYNVDIILAKCKRIKSVFAENTEITGYNKSLDVNAASKHLYKNCRHCDIKYEQRGFVSEQVEVGA